MGSSPSVTSYGSIVVPLQHQKTGAQAVGELVFDVRLRR
jgi:hypothetical protein